MNDTLFAGMMVVGAVLAFAGLLIGNAAPKHESCGCTGAMLVLGIVLFIIPPASVVVGLLAYYW